ncbi:MAG: hypothetical protein EP338_00700 [Bacteroidetes bacterium]|nr:MAG: hypothetical protein EP338_00700 [Bacteroidota bacterium]
MLRQSLFLILCFSTISLSLWSQEYTFKNYSVRDGVAQSQVYALLQDHRGYIWMGTRGGGITAFDGKDFKTFTEKDGLINNYVFCLKQDADQKLWIGTNKGLSSYNGKHFVNYHYGSKEEKFWVSDLATESSSKRLWLASNRGVLLFENGKFREPDVLGELPHELVNSILVDPQGIVWFGTGKGLFRIRPEGNKLLCESMGKISHYMNNAITCIRRNAKGQLWIGTYGGGAYYYDQGKFSKPDQNQELYRKTILDIHFDLEGVVRLASLSNGVISYHPEDRSFGELTEKEGLSNNHIRAILQDNCGNFWFGTSGGGVCHYFGKQFTTYNTSSGLGGNFIYSVFRDSQRRLWVGNSQQGLSCQTDSGFVQFNADNGFLNTKVKAICEDELGQLYFGTDGLGLYRYDGDTIVLCTGMDRKYIRSLVRDQRGRIWAATAGHGVFRIDPKNPGASPLIFNSSNGLPQDRVNSLFEDRIGRIWFGTESEGLGFIHNQQVYPEIIRKEQGLASNSIRSLAGDQRGNLWVGTAGSGVSFFPLYGDDQKYGTRIKSYQLQDGLTSANVYLLCFDSKDNLIIGSEAGLDLLVLDRQCRILQLEQYGRGDGFTGVETCQNSSFLDRDGTMWFGTINGLSHYNPARNVKNTNPPILHLTDVKLFYESLATTNYKEQVEDWNTVKQLVLPYDQNHLSFNFLGINLNNMDDVRYQWRLAGFDADWSPVSSDHQIVYSNLGPGKYLFLVRSCNEDGVWTPHPVRLPIEIMAPYWMNWWFIAGEVLLALLIIGFIIRWYIRRIRSQENEEKRKLQLQKNIVELEQKALRLQMNPHFIFNALNSIQALIGSGNEQQARYFLAKFSGLMRQILANSRKNMISLEEEVKLIENYLMVERFCNGDRFDYEIEVTEGLETDYIQVPPMIIQPFIENAIKHGFKDIDGVSNQKRNVLRVSFAEEKGQLICEVSDNGIGRKKSAEINQKSMETYHESTALLVTRERLELFESEKGSASLEIDDLYDENGQASGTKIVIRIPIN